MRWRRARWALVSACAVLAWGAFSCGEEVEDDASGAACCLATCYSRLELIAENLPPMAADPVGTLTLVEPSTGAVLLELEEFSLGAKLALSEGEHDVEDSQLEPFLRNEIRVEVSFTSEEYFPYRGTLGFGVNEETRCCWTCLVGVFTEAITLNRRFPGGGGAGADDGGANAEGGRGGSGGAGDGASGGRGGRGGARGDD
ncbi:MAG: hypothetical protein AAGA56_03000 [Myxococcota bacterium]